MKHPKPALAPLPPQSDAALTSYCRTAQRREQRRRQVLETRRQSAQEVAQAAAQLLRDRFGASRVVLFGSVLTADFHEASDIDLAVWGIAPADYFAAVGWLQGLSEFAIDLVEAPAPDYLKPAIEAGVTL